jgi:hypothetical protein
MHVVSCLMRMRVRNEVTLLEPRCDLTVLGPAAQNPLPQINTGSEYIFYSPSNTLTTWDTDG